MGEEKKDTIEELEKRIEIETEKLALLKLELILKWTDRRKNHGHVDLSNVEYDILRGKIEHHR